MAERPRFFDDIAGMAGGTLSALAGLREEAESVIRAQIDEAIRRLNLVRRDELDAISIMAANARAGEEQARAQLSSAEARIFALESRLTALETRVDAAASGGTTGGGGHGGKHGKSSGGGGPGMIA